MREHDTNIKVRPGYLVNLTTRLEGGVTYNRSGVEQEVEGSQERSEWTTEKIVADVHEHKLATATRGRVRSLIRSACVWTTFGMVCPTDKLPELDEKIAEARNLARAFNQGGGNAWLAEQRNKLAEKDGQEVTGEWAGAVHTKVRFATIRGQIAESTAEAVNAVRETVRGLLDELEAALRAGDVKGIRDVAANASQMERLLEEGSGARNALARAVGEARRVAREVVKRVEEGAEAAAVVIEQANMSLVATARHTFSEEETGEMEQTTTDHAMPAVAAGGWDLDDDQEISVEA